MIGESVGNFEIIAPLGHGGMGEVWLAEQKSIKTRVAIKVLRTEISKDKAHVDRFFGEAVAVSKIRHAGIVKIFDCGYLAQGQAYLVMEFLEGETLTNRIRRIGSLPVAEVCDIGRQIASVLDATHAAGVTHRDLKPDNVFLVADAEMASGERVKILDFGIAKLTGRVNVTATAAGAMGTPQYMSPEQWKSAAKADHRTDAYSLGCVAFEMMTGRPPFIAETIGEACAKHLSEAPPLTSSIAAHTPFALDELIGKLLDKEAANRPSMREAMAAFGAIGGIAPTTASVAVPRTTASGSGVDPRIGLDPTVPQQARAAPPLMTGGPPTTLGTATGVSEAQPRRRSKLPLIAGLAGVAVAGTAIAVIATRGSSGEGGKSPPPPATSSTTPDAAPEAKLEAPLISSKSLVRKTGELPELKAALGLTLCFDAAGAVTSIQVPADVARDVATEVRAKLESWTYEPYRQDGKAIGACTLVVLPAKGTAVAAAGEGSTKDPGKDPAKDPPKPPAKDPPKPPAKDPPPVKDPPTDPDVVPGSRQGPCDEVSCTLDPTQKCCRPRRRPPRDPDGGIDKATVQRAMAPVRASVFACASKASEKGVLRLRIAVAPDGSVSSVTVLQTPAPGINSCVTAAVRGARFPASARGATFNYPFLL